VNKTSAFSPLILCAAAALTVGAAAGTPALASPGAPPPGTPPLPPAAARADNDELDAQLEAARRKLEEAAHQVAELSAQMSRPFIEKFAAMSGEPGRAILGVQLEKAGGAAGARVREASPGGPAAEAGIRAGDVIVALNGHELAGEEATRQVVDIMREVKPDTKVNVRVLRDARPRDFTVTVRSGPDYFFARGHGMPDLELGPPGPMPPPGLLLRGPFMDMELVTLTPQLGRYFGADKGVLVVRSPAKSAMQLEDGDVILAIDGRQPLSGSHATRILASYQPGEKLSLHIIREHKTLDVQATLPNTGRMRERLPHDGPLPQVQQHRMVIQQLPSDDT
jgi:predicted metalloprotease with PDZ domain